MYLTEHEHLLPPSEETLDRFLHDPIIIRVVTILDISSLSTLELIEYGMTKYDIRYCYVNGIIQFDSAALACCPDESIIKEVAESYYDFWNRRKFRLTETGIYILECLELRGQDSAGPKR